jgi:hypothetical protein
MESLMKRSEVRAKNEGQQLQASKKGLLCYEGSEVYWKINDMIKCCLFISVICSKSKKCILCYKAVKYAILCVWEESG